MTMQTRRRGWALFGTIGLGIALLAGCEARPLGGPTVIVIDREDEPAAGQDETGEKAKQKPIYDEEADGKQLIADAVDEARRNDKRVLIEWGDNACGWCYKLHDVFKHDELVAPIVIEQYQLVLVDAFANAELKKSYGIESSATPYLTILDGEGKLLTNQATGELEEGDHHDPDKVAAVLKQWQPERADAEERLAAALRQATAEDKRVLMHVGTPYCGWCHVLTRFLEEHRAILSIDYVDLRIDTMRMENGDEVSDRLVPKACTGVPQMVILDASGKVLATSLKGDENIGYPYEPPEIEHFIGMLRDTKQRLVDEDLLRIQADLNAFREQRENENRTARRN